MRINNNLMAMNTHRQLEIGSTNGAKSMEKLSSGLRINRAGDDAAGLAISEKMRAQIRGLGQASRNAQDGISLIQTAEGALQETHAILQRMRELSVQSSNGTLTSDDRDKIQSEIDQLIDEVDKIGNQTEFNKSKLLNGEMGTVATSNNSFSDGHIKTAVTAMNTSADTKSGTYAVDVTTAGKQAYTAAAAWTGGITSGDTISFTVDGTTTTIGLDTTDDQMSVVDKINAKTEDNGVEAFINTSGGVSLRSVEAGTKYNISGLAGATAKVGIGAVQAGVNATVTIDGNATTAAGNNITATIGNSKGLEVKLQGVEEQASLTGIAFTAPALAGDSITINGTTITFDAATGANINTFTNTINSYSRQTGVTVTNDGTNVSFTTLAKGDQVGITISSNSALGGMQLGGLAVGPQNDAAIKGAGTYTSGTDNITDGSANNDANITVTASDVDFHTGANSGQTLSLQVGDMRSSAVGKGVTNASGFNNLNDLKTDGVTTSDKSEDAIKIIDEALKNVSDERAKLGAYQNRLEHTIKNLDNGAENLQAAESRIRDVDMAKEMMNFTKNNILQQAAQAMLAQANQAPQGVLQLLR